MTEQLSIDFEPGRLARSTDPQTSHEAASRVKEFASGQHEAIVAVLRKHGPATAYEISEHCGIQPHAVNKRTGELIESGAVRPVVNANGEIQTRKTPSGRHARVLYAI